MTSEHRIISENTREELAKYLAFRHFFVHAYSFLLDESELKVLVDRIFETNRKFKKEIDIYILNIEKSKK